MDHRARRAASADERRRRPASNRLEIGVAAAYFNDQIGERCTRLDADIGVGLVSIDLDGGSATFLSSITAGIRGRPRGARRAAIEFPPMQHLGGQRRARRTLDAGRRADAPLRRAQSHRRHQRHRARARHPRSQRRLRGPLGTAMGRDRVSRRTACALDARILGARPPRRLRMDSGFAAPCDFGSAAASPRRACRRAAGDDPRLGQRRAAAPGDRASSRRSNRSPAC